MSPCACVRIYLGEKCHQFAQENCILALTKSVETFVTVSINDMPSIKYCHNLGKRWILQEGISLNNTGLAIHVLHNCQLLEVIYTQDIQKILIMYTKTVMIFCQ